MLQIAHGFPVRRKVVTLCFIWNLVGETELWPRKLPHPLFGRSTTIADDGRHGQWSVGPGGGR
jgi:hypothetical protein